jgi:hypothetical protein
MRSLSFEYIEPWQKKFNYINNTINNQPFSIFEYGSVNLLGALLG